MTPPRRACDDWPRVLVPSPGCLSPLTDIRHDERVLMVVLQSTYDGGTPRQFLRALTSNPGDYREVSMTMDTYPDAELLEAAAEIRPTIVFLALFRDSIITPEVISELRPLCDPTCVIVNYDGDQHFEPGHIGRRWFVDLGRVCDASLVVNTKHPVEYAAMGVHHPGYLAPLIDETIWRPTEPTPGTLPIVCLANNWPRLDYTGRNAVFAAIAATFPDQFAVYGQGWNGMEPFPVRPFLHNEDEAGVYSAARAALSISIRSDLPRYTSNRLFYALCSGAVVLAESFPDCDGLGLEDGHNCLLWHGWDELRAHLKRILCTRPEDWLAMRAAARGVGLLHALPAFLGALAAIVDAVRGAR